MQFLWGLRPNKCNSTVSGLRLVFVFVFRVAFLRDSNQTYLSSLESAFALRSSGSPLLTDLYHSKIPNGETPTTIHGAPKGRRGAGGRLIAPPEARFHRLDAAARGAVEP